MVGRLQARRRTTRLGLLAGAALFLVIVLAAAGCGSSSTSSTATPSPAASGTGLAKVGGTITVMYHYPAPPKYMLDQFTAQTGVKVNWVQIGWDNLQTKIATAASSNTYFADLTDVDWSKVGEYAKTKWFVPLNSYFDPTTLKADVPQIDTFMANGQLLAMPFDASFTVTTVNTKLFSKAGITTMPTTLTEYTNDLKQIKAKGVVTSPLDIPFAAAEGLSTYWYQVTAAFGGQVLDANLDPAFTSPSSPGYKALAWMIDAYKSGLVPQANIGMTDYQGFTTEMAQGRVASVFSDYAGSVGSIYNVPNTSTVVNQVRYTAVPGVSGPAPSLANPDGVGIPVTAKNKQGAIEFIKWFTEPQNQAIWAGLDGAKGVIGGFPMPMRVSSLKMLASANKYAGASDLEALLGASRAEFPGTGAPSWYAQFSNAVYTNIHQAAAGSETVAQAINNIAAQVKSLKATQ